MMLLGYIFHDAAGNPWESCFDDATVGWDSVGFSIDSRILRFHDGIGF